MKFSLLTFLALLVSGSTRASPNDTSPLTANFKSLNISDLKAHFDELNQQEPINTFYFRNGKLVGDRLGVTNQTDTVAVVARNELSKRITVDNVNVNLLEVAGAAAIFAGIACALIPGCPAYVAANLGFASAADAAVELTTAVGTLGKKKRQDTEYEKFACIDAGGYDATCTNQDWTPDFIQAIGNNDGSTVGSSFWSLTDTIDGTLFGNIWHCQQEDADCGFIDNGPTGEEQDGGATGH